MDFDDLHDLADDRPNDRPELSSPIEPKTVPIHSSADVLRREGVLHMM